MAFHGARVERPVEFAQRLPLLPVLIEIRRVEPGLKVAAQGRPLVVQVRELSRIPVAPLDDGVLVRDALPVTPFLALVWSPTMSVTLVG